MDSKDNRDYKDIQYLVIDVDGTMTDGGLYYDENGNEMKKFSTKDAAGFLTAHKVGIKVMVLTGRECQATLRRMKEMKVECICQNVKDKSKWLRQFIKKHGATSENLAYIGDDLNDLEAMMLVGFVGCPSDACQEVMQRADYISTIPGGQGAVRDVICYLLQQREEWMVAIREVYGNGIASKNCSKEIQEIDPNKEQNEIK